ncbi:MAG TPA: DUF6134 family protein [Phenylobacterium sp.]|nr:DUF6134 family protein [Phenylobacterium sp.]
MLSVAALPGFARAAGPIPPANNLHFNILRNGKPFGQYRVAFVSSGDLLTVTTDVTMNMQIAKLSVFDYVHHCEEQWRGGRFVEMHSHTVRDKDLSRAEDVSAVRGDFGIHIKTRKDQLSAPPKASPLTHWNQATLSEPLFNPQDGLMLDLRTQQIGRDGVLLANATQLVGAHWTLRGSQTLDEWYDDTGVWAGLKAVFPDKSIIEYRRV